MRFYYSFPLDVLNSSHSLCYIRDSSDPSLRPPQNESAWSQYESMMSKLALFAMRTLEDPYNKYCVDMTEEQRDAVKNVLDKVESTVKEKINVDDMQRLFYSLFCGELLEGADRRAKSVVESFIIVKCLRPDEMCFIATRSIPPLMSRLMYVIRLVVVSECLQRAKEKNVSSFR